MEASSLPDLARPLSLLLLTYAIHSTLLLLGALLLARFVRSSARRDLLFKAALIGGLATAGAQSALGGAAVEAARLELSPRATAAPARGPRSGAAALQPSEAAWSAAGARSGSPEGLAIPGWTMALSSIWACGAGWGILALALRHRRLRSGLRRRRLPGGEARALARRLLASRRRAGGISFTCSPALTSPVALGPSEVCVPEAGWAALDGAGRENLLAHELAHLLRRDPTWLLLAQVIERVFFFQPLNRLVRRRMQAEAELLCDDWAARETGDPIQLARCLSQVAAWLERGAAPALVPGMARRPSSLVRRVERILGGGELQLSARGRALLLGGLLGGLSLFACTAPGVAEGESAPAREEAVIRAEIRSAEEAEAMGLEPRVKVVIRALTDDPGGRRLEYSVASGPRREPPQGARFVGSTSSTESLVALETHLERALRESSDAGAVLDVQPGVLYREVVLVLDLLMEVGFQEIVFLGIER